ncbi:CD9 antigen-like isoform X2 [Tachypleus tridentatus]|uniref:CD9 antigen-like isoform X2 n=1 Tax=Tachypleus tridentatus TaxID=6853 RepID=UPI003FD6AC39
MSSALSFMKYIIFTFNFILWCFGAALFGLGIWIRTDEDFWEYENNLPVQNYYQATYIVITVGAILLIIGFIGCCGAATDSLCLLLTYFFVMLVMVIMELAAAGLVWKAADGDKLQQFLTEQIEIEMEKQQYDENARRFMDLMQIHLKCCGATSMLDYRNKGWTIPQSCSDDRSNNVFIRGCGENLRRYLASKGGILGGMAIGLTLIQIACLLFSVCLFFAIKRDQEGI